jgi:O-antigen ligase
LTYSAHYGAAYNYKSGTLSSKAIANTTVFILVLSGAFVFSEPAPYELLALGIMTIAFFFGLRIPKASLPLLIMLLAIGFGGMIAMFFAQDFGKAAMYVAVTVFLAGTTFFFACYTARDTVIRLNLILTAWIFAAMAASVAGVLGYFNIAGTGELFSLFSRARGTFQDPNVFSAFLICPLVWCLCLILTRSIAVQCMAAIAAIIILAGLFLSFSRGAWGHAVLSGTIAASLIFLLTENPKIKARVLLGGVTGLAVLSLGIMAALSIPAIADLFRERATLNQAYDLGPMGRFGRQFSGIMLALDAPWGIGAREFAKIFPEDPHNVYLNMALSYGWIGFFSYVALVIITLIKMTNVVLQSNTLRLQAIGIYSALVGLVFLGFIIDTDHWRHFFLLVGLSWGLIISHGYENKSYFQSRTLAQEQSRL